MDPRSIAALLTREIEERILAPGTILRQEDLAQRFAVSRQPVRGALERLIADGLVVRRSDRSLAVGELAAQELQEVIAIRVLLESEALRLSLPRLSPTTLRKAARIADDLTEEEDPAAIEELDVAFHSVLYGAAGNARLLALIDTFRRQGRRAYAAQPKGSASRALYAKQHAAILRACAARDAAAALQALAEHLRSVPAGGEDREGRTP
jgi:DNA-binding GntR family transcriptional regulator